MTNNVHVHIQHVHSYTEMASAHISMVRLIMYEESIMWNVYIVGKWLVVVTGLIWKLSRRLR